MSVSELITNITAAANVSPSDVTNVERIELLFACQKMNDALYTNHISGTQSSSSLMV